MHPQILDTLLLQFTLYQSFADVKRVLSWLDPVGLSKAVLEEKAYFLSHRIIELFRSLIIVFTVRIMQLIAHLYHSNDLWALLTFLLSLISSVYENLIILSNKCFNFIF